ncbi:MAG: 50S ribosomal protein L14e [Candidatus Undinarchaeales archaeon]|nr:50S ribosomal protein L14e [Candidatus Undinarchaeales archaeon]MDP7493944.1 50S ribosomal protein L14e [Candidatus Undinarchaeales archaeon]
MPAIDVGRVCIKMAGRDMGGKCVIIDIVDDTNVLVSGDGVRRRKVNIAHLELLTDMVEVKKGASDADVAKALQKLDKDKSGK